MDSVIHSVPRSQLDPRRATAPVIEANRLIVGMPFSLDQCLEDWVGRDHGNGPWQWEGGWFPIAFHDNAVRIDCMPPQDQVAQAFLWAPDNAFPQRKPSDVRPFATVVRWWMEAWETGAYEDSTKPFPGFGVALFGEARQAAVPSERFGFV